ncbi:hypothetical protein [Acinetobacter pittii]|uniref:hypothetical protein n=1 Tax=Acinetobacter pittii TaxID=48296 RepID=UPI002A006760|nr:hypothetical protein [Acinetobacter pittii]MDX8160981.1 hypothetical protein [Acinetobacter pittii]MDX8265504.1 hypothetical protein [Acinetobacter pittii]
MKTFLAVLAGLAICVAIFANLKPKSVDGSSATATVKEENNTVNGREATEIPNKVSDTARQAVVEHFKKNERIAKDSVWTSKKMFKVGVLDNGKNRDGYASYVCQTLDDFGFKGAGISVQIIDIQKLVNTNKWIKLGEAQCN